MANYISRSLLGTYIWFTHASFKCLRWLLKTVGAELGAHSTDFRKKVPHFEHTEKADKKSPERNGIVLKPSLIENNVWYKYVKYMSCVGRRQLKIFLGCWKILPLTQNIRFSNTYTILSNKNINNFGLMIGFIPKVHELWKIL